MKKCVYCNSVVDNAVEVCPHCNANEFNNICDNCHKEYQGNFCPQCGTRFQKKAKTCPKCGELYYSNACPNCGYLPYETSYKTATQEDSDISNKSRTVAFLLCFFLGMFGVHQFYAGNVKKGIGYVFTGGWFGIGWMIDIFVVAFGGLRDSQGKRIAKF